MPITKIFPLPELRVIVYFCFDSDYKFMFIRKSAATLTALALLSSFFLSAFSINEVVQAKKTSHLDSTQSTSALDRSSTLASLPVFSTDELESFRATHLYPQPNDENWDKLLGLLKTYDAEQPTRSFSLGRKLRVANLNITRGYDLEKYKLLFKPDPAFERLVSEFPEVKNSETIEDALAGIAKSSEKLDLHLGKRTNLFYDMIGEMIDAKDSHFTKVLCTGFLKRPLESWDHHNNLIKKAKRETYGEVFELAQELYHLAKADIISLQEVDWGMPRSNYAHVSKEIANAIGYGYAYANEFIEFQDDGIPYSKLASIDQASFKGFHGNAILSKWPLENIRILRYGESFTESPSMNVMNSRRCYDWWRDELPKLGAFESGIYKTSEAVFAETPVSPSLRVGSRMALIADIDTPAGKVTVASTHLENRGNPKCRRGELTDLLNHLKKVTGQPVVIAGDMNTTHEEARRPYFRHAVYYYIKKRLHPPMLAAGIASSVGLFFADAPIPLNPIPTLVQIASDSYEWRNPSTLFSAERKLFRQVIDKFRFDDGGVIDTRGIPEFNRQLSDRYMSDSSESTKIGYKPTYCFARNYKHVFCMKLDWIFVKGNLTRFNKDAKDNANNDWAPTNPRTVFDSILAADLSNHAAVTTDLILPGENYGKCE